MPAAAVSNVLNSSESILNITFEDESRSNNSAVTLQQNNLRSDDSAAVALSISQEAYGLMNKAKALQSNLRFMSGISTEIFSSAQFDAEDFQREIVKTVSDIIKPYGSEEETRDAVLNQSMELETPAGTQDIKGLAYKLAYELDQYLLTYGKDNNFFPRLDNAIDKSDVQMNPIIQKIKSMIRDVENGTFIDINSTDLKSDFNSAIRSTFEKPEPNTVKSENDQSKNSAIDRSLKNQEYNYLDELKNSAEKTFSGEVLKTLFAEKNEDAEEDEDVNAGKEILKQILRIRESIDKVNDIIDDIEFQQLIRHLDDDETNLLLSSYLKE